MRLAVLLRARLDLACSNLQVLCLLAAACLQSMVVFFITAAEPFASVGVGNRYCMNAAALEFIEASKLPLEMKPLVKG